MQEIFFYDSRGIHQGEPFKNTSRRTVRVLSYSRTDPGYNRVGVGGVTRYMPDYCAVADAFKDLKAFEEINNTNIYIALAEERIPVYEKICELERYFNHSQGWNQMSAVILDIYDEFDEHSGKTELWLASNGTSKIDNRAATEKELRVYVNYPNTNKFSFEVGTRNVNNLNLNEYLIKNTGGFRYWSGYPDQINCLVKDAGGKQFPLQLYSNMYGQKSSSNFYINENASDFLFENGYKDLKQYQLAIERKEKLNFSCKIPRDFFGDSNIRYVFNVDFTNLPHVVNYWKLVGSDILFANDYEIDLSRLLEASSSHKYKIK